MSALLLPALAASSSGQGALYVDDVFSTYLRTGTGADTTVTTGIDMTKGYMLWSKGRGGATEHAVYDSARGVTLDLVTNSNAAQTTQATGLKAVSSIGHTIGSLAKMNTLGATYVDWVFRKAPKFFDVVTYTGNGASNRSVAHSLGVAPGIIIVKAVSGTYAVNDWYVYHRTLGATKYLSLNQTLSAGIFSGFWSDTEPTTTVFTVGPNSAVNQTNTTYVAYLFAHDPSAEGIIQCGSFTTDASGNATVNLGWEPQWLLYKRSNGTSGWHLQDNMRGFVAGTSTTGNATLIANATLSESSNFGDAHPSSTGFSLVATDASSTYIYLVIRRPNKPPTTGAEVYNAIARTGTGAAAAVTGVGFAPDWLMASGRVAGYNHTVYDRLRGAALNLWTNLTNAETTGGGLTSFDMNGITVGTSGNINENSINYINHFFRRATGFFDVVCYTGTGVARTVNHNLGTVPELMMVKQRNGVNGWAVYASNLGFDKVLFLNLTDSAYSGASNFWVTTPTTTSFTVGTASQVNGGTHVAYLFATLPGISKVGSYTGNGSSQTIDCGFSTGARFFLVKAASTTGSWWVYDSARGIVSAADPALQLNSTAAEITSADAVDPTSAGIIVNQEATCSINATGVSYIFLAIA